MILSINNHFLIIPHFQAIFKFPQLTISFTAVLLHGEPSEGAHVTFGGRSSNTLEEPVHVFGLGLVSPVCFWYHLIDSFSLNMLYQLEMIATSWLNSPYTFLTRRPHRWWFFKTWRHVGGGTSRPTILLYMMISLGTQIKLWASDLSLVNVMFLLLQLESNLWYHAFTLCEHTLYQDFNIH